MDLVFGVKDLQLLKYGEKFVIGQPMHYYSLCIRIRIWGKPEIGEKPISRQPSTLQSRARFQHSFSPQKRLTHETLVIAPCRYFDALADGSLGGCIPTAYRHAMVRFCSGDKIEYNKGLRELGIVN
jgi:hypothetical protein